MSIGDYFKSRQSVHVTATKLTGFAGEIKRVQVPGIDGSTRALTVLLVTNGSWR